MDRTEDYTEWQANFFTKNESVKSFSQKAMMYRKNLENSPPLPVSAQANTNLN